MVVTSSCHVGFKLPILIIIIRLSNDHERTTLYGIAHRSLLQQMTFPSHSSFGSNVVFLNLILLWNGVSHVEYNAAVDYLHTDTITIKSQLVYGILVLCINWKFQFDTKVNSSIIPKPKIKEKRNLNPIQLTELQVKYIWLSIDRQHHHKHSIQSNLFIVNCRNVLFRLNWMVLVSWWEYKDVVYGKMRIPTVELMYNMEFVNAQDNTHFHQYCTSTYVL